MVGLALNATPMTFTGLQLDPETNMSHAENRQLRMQIGRWMTADPSGKGAAMLEDPQTWNLYAYVRNDPMTLTDPSGLTPDQEGPDIIGCTKECQDKGAGPQSKNDKKAEEKKPDPVRAPKTSITVSAGLALSEDATLTEILAGSGPEGWAILAAFLG